MSKFNGHKNWNHWNVSLWINNDYGLYQQARYCVRSSMNKEAAARKMMETLKAEGVVKTPDGAPYSVSTIKAAMVEM